MKNLVINTKPGLYWGYLHIVDMLTELLSPLHLETKVQQS